MSTDGVRSIEVEGFASIRHAKVELGKLNILVGANGSGKSNLIRALEMLGRIADGDLQFFVSRAGQFASLVHQPSHGEILLTVDAPPYGYRAVLLPSADGAATFAEERVRDRDTWYPLGRGHRESKLLDPVRVQRIGPAGERAIDTLAGCRVYHFHDTSISAPAKQPVETADNLTLHSDAGNLAAYLLRLSEEGGQAYRRIVRAVQLVAPFFRDFVLRPERARVELRWRQVDSDAVFSAHQLSDGTLRFICLVTLLQSPELPRIVVLDEPELGLHPFAIVQLAGMLRSAAVDHQVVVATQSVTLINQFELSELIVVERSDGASNFTRPDPESLQAWLEDYSLGELWEKNLLGGRPQRERHR